MKWPWQSDDSDPRPAHEVDLDAEFEHTRRRMLSALEDLKLQVDRARLGEAAHDRYEQRRGQPGTA